MSKKIMKRSLALGALMAFVITGSAWADCTSPAVIVASDARVEKSNKCVNVIDQTFVDNDTKTVAKGGAINITNGSGHNIRIENCSFEGYETYDKGGVISTNGANGSSKVKLDIVGLGNVNLFKNNSALYWGGVINSEGNSEISLSGTNTFESNIVTNRSGRDPGAGGAIGLELDNKSDILNITGKAVFTKNIAALGGAIYSSNISEINFDDCAEGTKFENNIVVGASGRGVIDDIMTASNVKGGAIYNSGEINVKNSYILFKRNTAVGKYGIGGAVYNSGEINFDIGSYVEFEENVAGANIDMVNVRNILEGYTINDGYWNDIHNTGTINIKQGATVNLDGGITGDGEINIIGGKINLNARSVGNARNSSGIEIGIENAVQNDGEINIEKGVEATFTNSIDGNGIINIDGGALVADVGNLNAANSINMNDSAIWNVTGSGDSYVNKLRMSDDSIIKHNSDKNITVTSYSGNGTIEFNSDGHLHIDSGSGTLNLSASDLTTESIVSLSKEEVAEKFNDVAGKLGVKDEAKGIKATIVVAEGDIVGETTGIVTYAKDKVNGYYHGVIAEENITEKANAKNQSLSDAGISLKLHWRAHINDMNKRMGELRNAEGEHGVWARMVRGESEYKNTKAQYNQYQLGYDEKLSVDKRWTVGAAVTFAEGDANYGQGSTEDKSTAFAIYGSKLNNDGTFVDLIARYAHLESDLDDVNSGKGDYATNGMSVIAEFGKRIQQGNGLWIEPQVELTYGTIDSAEFMFDSGKAVQVGDMDSLIGRVGFRIGKDLEQGNVYARASYLYDFEGETENAFSNATDSRTIAEDLGGGWWEVGVGANINLSKATYVYADVEKTFGGEVDTNWQWNLGVRYSF